MTGSPIRILAALALVVAAIVVYSGCYTVLEGQQVILTQFGKPVGQPIETAGLKFRIPFIQTVNRIEKRILEWDGQPNDMPTKDKLYISVDTFARWRIRDPLQYFVRFREERSALSRLDDILGSEVRNAVAKHELIEIIRTTRDRQPQVEESLKDASQKVGVLLPIQKGRTAIEQELFEKASEKLEPVGIELLDVRFKRINYNQDVLKKIYDRMVSERQQIASRFRSEGEGEAARILGNKERALQEIRSEAYRTVQEIEGKADAEASAIYADAYNRSPQTASFYQFVKTMEAYRKTLSADATLILTTDSDLFRFLKSMGEPAPAAPGAAAASPREQR